VLGYVRRRRRVGKEQKATTWQQNCAGRKSTFAKKKKNEKYKK
jgi:hypothetical protein